MKDIDEVVVYFLAEIASGLLAFLTDCQVSTASVKDANLSGIALKTGMLKLGLYYGCFLYVFDQESSVLAYLVGLIDLLLDQFALNSVGNDNYVILQLLLKYLRLLEYYGLYCL